MRRSRQVLADDGAPPGVRAMTVGGDAEANRGVTRGARLRGWAVAFGLYLVISAAFWVDVWAKGPRSTMTCACGDSSITLWFQGFAAHALSHWQNPFFTTLLWHPRGINVLDAASQLGLGLPMAPITWAFGSVFSMNLGLGLSTCCSALAMYVLLDRWALWRPGAFVGGLLYGFSPVLLINMAQGRLMIAMMVIPPLIVLLVDGLLQRPSTPIRLGAVLGLLIVLQFFISSEVLVITALACAVGLAGVVVAGAITGDVVAPRVYPALKGFLVAAATAAVLLAYPAWFMLFGPANLGTRVYPSTNLGTNGVTALGFIWPQAPSATFATFTHRVGGYQGPLPSSQYVGITLALFVFVGVCWFWRDRRLWLFGGIGLIFSWSAFGSSHGGWLPWDLFVNSPALENIIPSRFLYVTFFCVGVVTAIIADHLVHRLQNAPVHLTARSAGGWGIMVLVVALLPPVAYYRQLVPLTPQRVVVPTWFTTVAPRLPHHQVLLVIPVPFSAIYSSLTWQSETHFSYAMVGGAGPGADLAFAGRTRLAQELLSHSSAEFTPSTVTPAGVVAVRQALEGWGVTRIVMPVEPGLPRYDRPLLSAQAAGLITAASGKPPTQQAGALVWVLAGHRSMSHVVSTSAFTRCTDPRTATPASASACVLGQ